MYSDFIQSNLMRILTLYCHSIKNKADKTFKMKKSDKPSYNYNYLVGEEAYIKCAECGAECLCHDGEYECSVCGNTGRTGEPMPELDDRQWFEA